MKNIILAITITLCLALSIYIYMVSTGKLFTENQVRCIIAANANVDYVTALQQAETPIKKGK